MEQQHQAPNKLRQKVHYNRGYREVYNKRTGIDRGIKRRINGHLRLHYPEVRAVSALTWQNTQPRKAIPGNARNKILEISTSGIAGEIGNIGPARGWVKPP